MKSMAEGGKGQAGRGPRRLVNLLAGIGMAALCTAVAWLCHSWGDLAFFLMVYLLGAVLVAWRWGRLAAGVTAVLGLLSYDLLFKTHAFSFTVADGSRFVAFLGLVAIAQFVADLIHRLREQTRQAQAREQEAALRYALTRRLAGESSSEGILRVAEAFLREETGHPFTLDRTLDPTALRVLEGSRGPLGVIRGEAAAWQALPQDFRESTSHQIALALERALSHEEAQRARAEAERERTCSALLSAVSHDFRTPLSAIRAAAATLAGGNLSPEEQGELTELLQLESQRLDRLVANLLDLTRLEQAHLSLVREWQPLEEVVGAALSRLEAALGPLPVEVHLPEDLPPLPIDAALVELLFTNLLENAHRHAPGAAVTLRAWPAGDTVGVEVADRGPGIPEADRERIFGRFIQGRQAPRDGGVGLGLAICRAIVQVHGGRIWVEESPGGGAAFRFTLPC